MSSAAQAVEVEEKFCPNPAGRPIGALGKITNDARRQAKRYGPMAMRELARLATKAINENARVSACKEILDRAYGKSKEYIDVNVSGQIDIRSIAVSAVDDLIEGSFTRKPDQLHQDPLSN